MSRNDPKKTLHRTTARRPTNCFATALLIAPLLLALSTSTRGGEGDVVGHTGPDVEFTEAGPWRYVGPLHAAFRMERAMQTIVLADGFYREPANDGFNAVLDGVAATLRRAGYVEGDGLFTVQEIVTPRSDLAWTPQSAQIVLLAPKSARTVLHSFAGPADRDRVVLPAGAPSCDVEGDVVFAAQQLEKGQILVTDQPLKSVLAIAQQRGAAAVFSASLESYNRDPTGRERHLDAIQYQSVPHGTTMPVAQISPRSMAVIKQAQGSMPGVRLAFKARVAWSDRPLRTLVATIAGRRRAEQAVALAAHVQEPGACDNASGVGGMTEAAVCLAESIRGGRLPRPERTLVFLWGNEMDQTRIWLEKTDHKVVAGIAIDMIGESATQTGAIALLERSPDPGALSPLAPDVHTTWGAGEVDEQTIVPNGLAVIARCALADVARLENRWRTAEHPWEGGSDHDVFLERGVPAILFWHFPDFAYHTSLDRLEHVDPTEVRRMSVAALATALSLTSPSDGDLSRYLATLDREQSLRLRAAEQVQDTAISEQWRQWCHQSGEWLRETCAVLERRD